MRRTFCGIVITAALACISHNVLAADSEPSNKSVSDDPDWKAGKAAIEAKSWKSAVDSFNKAASKFKDSADVYNYLGYSYRQSGDLDSALKNYKIALQIEPAHKGAHEYMGEAYLMKHDLPDAQKHLQELERICSKSCDEYKDLAQAIEDFKAKKPIASKW
jgi:Flp pilus assembly protein TadD